jgi:hypothetical protein
MPDDGSSIGHVTDWKSLALDLRAEVGRLRHELMVAREDAVHERLRAIAAFRRRCEYVCAAVGALAALDRIKQLDVDET